MAGGDKGLVQNTGACIAGASRRLQLMASGNDMNAHESTYGGFMTLLKVTLPIIALIGVLVIYLIH